MKKVIALSLSSLFLVSLILFHHPSASIAANEEGVKKKIACGPLTQEAENGQLSGNFEVGNDPTASNGQYVHVFDGAGDFWKVAGNNHKAEYCFNVLTEGRYRIKMIFYGETYNNSFFCRSMMLLSMGICGIHTQ